MSNQYAPDTLTTPGEVLADYLDSFAITPERLAARTGLAGKIVDAIIKGKAPIKSDTARKLSQVFGRPEHFWINLENQFQKDCKRF